MNSMVHHRSRLTVREHHLRKVIAQRMRDPHEGRICGEDAAIADGKLGGEVGINLGIDLGSIGCRRDNDGTSPASVEADAE